MAQRGALLMAGVVATGASAGARCFPGRLGLSRGIHAELPHPAQALVEPVRAGRCAFHQLISVRAPHEFPETDPWPLHLLKGGASRQCVSRAHGGKQALVRSQSTRWGSHRRCEGGSGGDAKSGCTCQIDCRQVFALRNPFQTLTRKECTDQKTN